MKKILFTISTLFFLQEIAEGQLIFKGQPVYRCETGWKGEAKCEKLEAERSIRLITTILEVKNEALSTRKFVWGEDGRELFPGPPAVFTTWMGMGMYIKVWQYEADQKMTQDIDPSLFKDLPKELGYGSDVKWLYMEHTQIGLSTITYYGIGTAYNY